MSVIKLIGDAPNQVSRNKDLGDLAFQDRTAVNIGGGAGAFTTLGTTNLNVDGGSSNLAIFRLGSAQSGSLISMRDASGTELLSVNGNLTTMTTPSISIRSGFVLDYLGTGFIRGTGALKIHDNHAGNIELAVGGGNVGIGTTSPGAKLHVSGSFRVGTASDYVQVNQTNTNVWSILNSPAGTYSIVFNTATANVGINASGVTPVASALLDVQSTTKGVRMPNMTTTQKNAIASPAAGLMVFDTTLSKLCVYSGAAWETITSV